ncbi:MAG: hypothetical protein M1608_10145, partial [Candidatus Omnitrophica bacterium]|nr:hypothetical protein [Candidatus Omnitrophota bacterium]
MRIFQTNTNDIVARWSLLAAFLLSCSAAMQAQTATNLAGQFQFVSANFQTSESESTISDPSQDRSIPGALITVVRLKGSQGKMLVDFATLTNGTAKPDKDFVATNGTLVFDDFQMSASFILQIKDNSVTNDNKTVKMVLSNPRPAPDEDQSLTASLGSVTNATLTILDNDTGFNFDRLNYRVNENGGSITLKVILPEGGADGTSVDYRAEKITTPMPGSDVATPDVDFTAASGTLNFGQGVTEQTIQLMITDDSDLEFNEDFQVTLLNSTAKISVAVTNLTIETNDTGGFVTNSVVETNDVPLPLGKVNVATITILPDDTPPGGADPEYNPEMSKVTSPPYNPTPGANNTVYALEIQPDGKAIIGGDFTAVNAVTRNRVARLNSDGSLDTEFKIGTGADGSVAAVQIQVDGKILIGGGFTSFNGLTRYSLARLNDNGSLDAAFNPGTGINGPVRAMAVTDQNQVIIGGDFTEINGISRNAIARLNPDGTLDATFDPGSGVNGTVYAVAAQSDGRLVIGGDFTLVNGLNFNSIARLNSDGSVDPNFNPGSGADGAVYALLVRQATTMTTSADSAMGNSSTNVIPTGDSTGTLALNYQFLFDTNTMTTNSLRVYYETNLIQDTTIVVSTNSNTSGSFSVDFGPGQSNEVTIVVNEGFTNSSSWHYTVTITTAQAEAGKIILGGDFNSIDLQPRGGIAQLNSDGSLDNDYDPGQGVNNAVYSLAFSQKMQVYLGGAFTTVNGTRRVGIARLLSDGKVDTSFLDTTFNQYAGLVSFTTLDPNRFVNAIGVQTNGDLIIGGDFKMLGAKPSANTISDS